MAGEFSVKPVPLSYHDEAAHRRLLAERANVIGYEYGQFTPTFDFATPGDLSNSYETQEGFFWRTGPIVHFDVLLVVTPTFTTSAGVAKIGGLPHMPMVGGPQFFLFPIRLGGTGINWVLSDTVAFARPNQDWIEVALQGTSADGQTMTSAEITSGSRVFIGVTGFYAMADRA